MSFIEIKTKKGTADINPPAGYTSLLDLREKKKGGKATACKAMLCDAKADVGGHLIKSGEGGKEYILPLCNSHNNKP